MDETLYDISHLLDKAAASPAAVPARMARSAGRALRRDAEAVQQALAQELLEATAAHEELIRQYLRLRDGDPADADR